MPCGAVGTATCGLRPVQDGAPPCCACAALAESANKVAAANSMLRYLDMASYRAGFRRYPDDGDTVAFGLGRAKSSSPQSRPGYLKPDAIRRFRIKVARSEPATAVCLCVTLQKPFAISARARRCSSRATSPIV